MTEKVLHLLRAAKVEGAIRHAHSVRIAANVPRLDAEHDVLQISIFRIDVVHIIGRHKPSLVAGSQVQELLVHIIKLGDAMGLEFEEEPILAKDLIVPIEPLCCRLDVPSLKGTRHIRR